MANIIKYQSEKLATQVVWLAALSAHFQSTWTQASSYSWERLLRHLAVAPALLLRLTAAQLLARPISSLQVIFQVFSHQALQVNTHGGQASRPAKEFWLCSAILDGFGGRTSWTSTFLRLISLHSCTAWRQLPSPCPALLQFYDCHTAAAPTASSLPMQSYSIGQGEFYC